MELVIEVPVSSQVKCAVMYFCVVGMSMLPLFTLVFIVFWNSSDSVVFRNTFNCKLSNIDTTAYQNDLDLKLGIVLIRILVTSFILGNEHLHQLTAQIKYSLRINTDDFESNQRYAVYKQFVVGDEKSGYKLTVGGYKGNAGMS
jgi:hypothetical protein